MEYVNENLGVKFTLPDEVTVRQQLAYRGRVFAAGLLTEDIYLRYWSGFLALYDSWECKLLPDPKGLDVDSATDPGIADLIFWVGNRTAQHMLNLEELPKN